MAATLEERMAALEAEVEGIKRQGLARGDMSARWWKPFVGAFKDDPLFEDAVRLGREYRQGLRPSENRSGEDGT